jgi:hypothetical protein
MTFKISRVPTKESYNVTSNWLNNYIQKEALSVEDYKPACVEKFSTIPEKMSDLKNRVGFKKVEELKKSSSEASCSGNSCECVSCGSNNQSPEASDLMDKLRRIVNYAKKVLDDRPDIKHMQLVHDCRRLPQFQEISGRIEGDKFKSLIKKVMSGVSKPKDISEIEHVPYVERHQFGDLSSEDNIPSYYKRST